MAKEIEKNKKFKISNEEIKGNKKLEGLFCIVIGVIFLVLFVQAYNNYVYVPATMITLCLELFSIAYLVRNDSKKTWIIGINVIMGVILLITAIIYTIVKTV